MSLSYSARACSPLTHPMRTKLLNHLMVEGPATASQAARAAGDMPSNSGYHLRILAKYGWVAAGDSPDGRERPWRALVTGFDVDLGADPAGPAGRNAMALTAMTVQETQQEVAEALTRASTQSYGRTSVRPATSIRTARPWLRSPSRPFRRRPDRESPARGSGLSPPVAGGPHIRHRRLDAAGGAAASLIGLNPNLGRFVGAAPGGLALADGECARVFAASGAVSAAGQAVGMLVAGLSGDRTGAVWLPDIQGLLPVVGGVVALRRLSGSRSAVGRAVVVRRSRTPADAPGEGGRRGRVGGVAGRPGRFG